MRKLTLTALLLITITSIATAQHAATTHDTIAPRPNTARLIKLFCHTLSSRFVPLSDIKTPPPVMVATEDYQAVRQYLSPGNAVPIKIQSDFRGGYVTTYEIPLPVDSTNAGPELQSTGGRPLGIHRGPYAELEVIESTSTVSLNYRLTNGAYLLILEMDYTPKTPAARKELPK